MSFSTILNLSVSASWLVGAIVLVRPLLKKAPKAMICALWALVAIRLLCPVLPESPVSLIPAAEFVPERYLTMEPAESSEIQATLSIVTNPNFPDRVDLLISDSVERLQWKDLFWTLNWWVGMALMALYAFYSYVRLRLRTRVALCRGEGIYLCDDIDSPFILGILRPRICLPSGMDPAQTDYVIAHERAHLERLDHWWKPLGFLLLTVHWFNPVMWVAYCFLCRDIELACDERVIRDLDRASVRAYSEALVACSTRQKFAAACPLAFGEVGVTERIRTMVRYKKPAFWMILTACLLIAVLAVCFLTNPQATTMGNLENLEFQSVFPYPETITLSDGIYEYRESDHSVKIIDLLAGIELDPVPASRSVSEDREWCYLLYGTGSKGHQLCIGADFQTVWTMDPHVKSSYTYAVKKPEVLRAALARYFPGIDWNVMPFAGTYVSSECLYMHPASSWYPYEGDSGEIYRFSANYFSIESGDGSVTIHDPVNWDWKPMDWEAEPFARLDGGTEVLTGPDLKTMVSGDAVFVALGTDQSTILIYDQEKLYLVYTAELNKIGWSVWSIYSLVPEMEREIYAPVE